MQDTTDKPLFFAIKKHVGFSPTLSYTKHRLNNNEIQRPQNRFYKYIVCTHLLRHRLENNILCNSSANGVKSALFGYKVNAHQTHKVSNYFLLRVSLLCNIFLLHKKRSRIASQSLKIQGSLQVTKEINHLPIAFCGSRVSRTEVKTRRVRRSSSSS